MVEKCKITVFPKALNKRWNCSFAVACNSEGDKMRREWGLQCWSTIQDLFSEFSCL